MSFKKGKRARPNAPRVPWSQIMWTRKNGKKTIKLFTDEQGDFKDEYVEYSEDMAVCYDLVDIAKGVLNRPDLRLITGSPNGNPPILRAATDGRNIFLPKMHPNRRIATKHELAHIYFKSDIPLRLVFVNKLISDLEAESKKNFPHVVRSKLQEDLCFFINILDDVRVNSLWGLLYPGDGVDMDEWYSGIIGRQMMKEAMRKYPRGDVLDLFTYMKLMVLGQEPTSSRWGRFEKEVDHVRHGVLFTTFPATLQLVEELTYKVAREILEDIKDADEKEKEDLTDDDGLNQILNDRKPREDKSLVDALVEVESDPKPGKEFSNDNAGFDYRTQVSPEDKVKARKRLDKLSQQTLADLEQAGVDQVVSYQRAMKNMRPQPRTRDFLTKECKADVRIHQVRASDIVPAILSPEEVRVARQWRSIFRQVMSTLEYRLEMEGEEFVPDAYLQQKMMGHPLECFRKEVSGRGFRMNLLVDMSTSMTHTFPVVARLVRVLQVAMDFPFVDLRVQGFNSRSHGGVDFYTFPPKPEGLVSAVSKVEGLTPLSHAIQISGRTLAGWREETHIFVLSDGFPVYLMKDKQRVSTASLVNWTADEVERLRLQKTKTWCFMLGQYTPGESDMDRMFGPRMWRAIPTNDVYNESFSFIKDQFLRFLMNR
jgi:hypothetical protein